MPLGFLPSASAQATSASRTLPPSASRSTRSSRPATPTRFLSNASARERRSHADRDRAPPAARARPPLALGRPQRAAGRELDQTLGLRRTDRRRHHGCANRSRRDQAGKRPSGAKRPPRRPLLLHDL